MECQQFLKFPIRPIKSGKFWAFLSGPWDVSNSLAFFSGSVNFSISLSIMVRACKKFMKFLITKLRGLINYKHEMKKSGKKYQSLLSVYSCPPPHKGDMNFVVSICLSVSVQPSTHHESSVHTKNWVNSTDPDLMIDLVEFNILWAG